MLAHYHDRAAMTMTESEKKSEFSYSKNLYFLFLMIVDFWSTFDWDIVPRWASRTDEYCSSEILQSQFNDSERDWNFLWRNKTCRMISWLLCMEIQEIRWNFLSLKNIFIIIHSFHTLISNFDRDKIYVFK